LEEEEQALLCRMPLPTGRALDAGQELGPGEKKDAGGQGGNRRVCRARKNPYRLQEHLLAHRSIYYGGDHFGNNKYKLLGVVKLSRYIRVCLSMSRKISEFQTDLRSGTVSKDDAIPVLLYQQRQTSFLTRTETDFWGKVAIDGCFCVLCFTPPDARVKFPICCLASFEHQLFRPKCTKWERC
jgi:hypothetical protein